MTDLDVFVANMRNSSYVTNITVDVFEIVDRDENTRVFVFAGTENCRFMFDVLFSLLVEFSAVIANFLLKSFYKIQESNLWVLRFENSKFQIFEVIETFDFSIFRTWTWN